MRLVFRHTLLWATTFFAQHIGFAQTEAESRHLNDSLLYRLRHEQLSPTLRAELLYRMEDYCAAHPKKPEDKAYYLSLIPEALVTAKAQGHVEQQIEFHFVRFREMPDSAIDRSSPSITDTIVQLMRQSKHISQEYYRYTNTMRNHYALTRMVQRSIDMQRFEVELAERAKDPVRSAQSTLMLCNSFVFYGNPALAWQQIRQAQPIADTTTNWELKYMFLHGVSSVYKAENKLDSAEHWLRRAIQFFEKTNQKPAYTSDYDVFIDIFEQSAQTDSALFYLRKLLTQAETNQHRGTLANAYSGLGNFHLRHGALDSARFYMEKALQASSGYKGFYYVEQATSRLCAGEYFTATKLWAEAVPHLRSARSLFDSLPTRFSLQMQLKANQLLANCYEKLGDPYAALTCLRLASALSDTLFKENEGKKAAQLGIAVEAERYQKEVGEAERQSQQQGRVAMLAGVMMVFFLGLAAFAWRQLTQKRKLFRDLEREKTKSEALLLNILPVEIASRLKSGQHSIADHFDEASVIFIDIVGFTQMAVRQPPAILLGILNDIFTRFDALTTKHGLEKIKTIGDCYMAVAGVPHPAPDHLEKTVEMARDILAEMQASEFAGERVSFRMGIETGPLVAGVIGEKRFIYDLWGDTVNTASRMESSGLPDAVHTTRRVYDRLRDRYAFESRGFIEIKGKGSMETFLLR